MVILRLARHGRKNRPSFRVVAQDKQRAPSSSVIETIGHYNPLTHPATFAVKAERVTYWLGQGAQVSNTLHNLLVEKKIMSGEKRRVTRAKKSEEAESPAAPETAQKTEAASAA